MESNETEKRPLHPVVWGCGGCALMVLLVVIAGSFMVRSAILRSAEERKVAALEARELQRVQGGVLRGVTLAPGETTLSEHEWAGEDRLIFGVEHEPDFGDILGMATAVTSGGMQGGADGFNKRANQISSDMRNARIMMYDFGAGQLSEVTKFPENLAPRFWYECGWSEDCAFGVVVATPEDLSDGGDFSSETTVYVVRPGEKPEWEKLTQGSNAMLSPDGEWVAFMRWEDDKALKSVEAPSPVEGDADEEDALGGQAEENGDEKEEVAESADDEDKVSTGRGGARAPWYVVRLDGSEEMATTCSNVEALKWEMVDGKATGLLLVKRVDAYKPWAKKLTRVALPTGKVTEIPVTATPKLRLGAISDYEKLFMRMNYTPGTKPPKDEAESGDVIALDMRTGKARLVAKNIAGEAPVSVLGGKLVILNYVRDEDSEAESAGVEESSGSHATKYVLLDTETGKSAVVKFPMQLWSRWDTRRYVSVSPSGRRVAYSQSVKITGPLDFLSRPAVYEIAYPEELFAAVNK